MIALNDVARTLGLLPIASKQMPTSEDTARAWAETPTRSIPRTAGPQPPVLADSEVKANHIAIAASGPHTPKMHSHWRYLIIGLLNNVS